MYDVVKSAHVFELANKVEPFMIILLLIFRAEKSFYKLSNLKVSDNPLKTLKKERKNWWMRQERSYAWIVGGAFIRGGVWNVLKVKG